jgi:hypothetical protein
MTRDSLPPQILSSCKSQYFPLGQKRVLSVRSCSVNTFSWYQHSSRRLWWSSRVSSQRSFHHPVLFWLKISETKQLHRQTYIMTRNRGLVSRFFCVLWLHVSGESVRRTRPIKTRPVFQILIGYRKHARGMGPPNQLLMEAMDYVRLRGSCHWYPRRLDGARLRQTATKIHLSRTCNRDGQLCCLACQTSKVKSKAFPVTGSGGLQICFLWGTYIVCI